MLPIAVYQLAHWVLTPPHREQAPSDIGDAAFFCKLAFSITERWIIEMQILRTARPLHDRQQIPTA